LYLSDKTQYMHRYKIPTHYSDDSLPNVLPRNWVVFQWTLAVKRSDCQTCCLWRSADCARCQLAIFRN